MYGSRDTLQCVAACCNSVLQGVTVCCSMCLATHYRVCEEFLSLMCRESRPRSFLKISTPVPLLCLIVPLSRTKRIFGLVPEKPILSEPGSILVDGFDTRLIPWSFSCGERSLWVYCVVMCHVCNLSWCVMYTMCCDVSCIQCVVMCHVCNVLWCVMSS